jgi:phospholipid/cholesterol/gamma-HCH transport system substrate-binding protein
MSRAARLGIFIVFTLGIFAVGIFIIGSKQYLFRPTFQLKAQFDNVAGLFAGADVEVGGVHSGTVQSIDLPHRPGEKVTVVMNLDQRAREIVKADSVASIETQGLLGNQYLAVSFGSPGQPDVKSGDTLQSVPPLEMSAMVKRVNGILENSQKAVANATEATAHLNSISARIDKGQGTIGALVNDKQLYNNMEQTADTLQDTVQHANAGVTNFQEDMEALKHNFFLSGFFKKRGYEDSSELAANRISALPQAAPAKEFTFSAKQLFDGRDSARLKNQKALQEAGEYLSQNQFAVAVVVTTTGMEGDSQADQTLTEARAMVIREYLVENFGFDDTLLKTFGMGKHDGDTNGPEGGTIKILIFPTGTSVSTNPPSNAAATAPANGHGQPARTEEPKQ